MPVAQRRNRVEINAAGIISAVAQQNDGPDGQIACFRGELLQAIADARRGSCRMQFVEAADSRRAAIEAVNPGLVSFLEVAQDAILQRFNRLIFARRAIIRNGHAARIVHNNGDDIFLRLKFCDGDSGLPQQHEHEGCESKFENPDNAGMPVFYLRSGSRKMGPNEIRKRSSRRDDQQIKNPLRPGAQQHEMALGEDRNRILE